MFDFTKIESNNVISALARAEYPRNRDKLEVVRLRTNHKSARTTSLYDRRNDQISLGVKSGHPWETEL